jgi:hypothetical protein
MIHIEPLRSPILTCRMLTLLSLPTTATWKLPCHSVTARWGMSRAPFDDLSARAEMMA